ncbi:unnamed protein product [Protopolystoma xenopodis]|uniref:Sas10 C-terminal domain-containing protein n=1 Tax=Protopolystoma xenopodis TaxID=117903 RepID=A0A3S4ZWK7_9PLAT|nr:unnamed protein product [Protopolystoma xenopodis]
MSLSVCKLRLDKNASDHPQADLTTAASVDDESCIDVGSDDDADRDGGEMEVQEMSTGDSFPTEGGFVKKFGTENRPMSRMMFENRGLVKYRHKRERNPRVHLRYKYKKATIRYRSRIPPVRKEDKPYSGEARGIRANLIRSQKFSKH